MMTLAEARDHIDEGVVYRTAYGRTEDGVITSVNDRFVFVRYGGDQHSKATDPAALTLLARGGDEPCSHHCGYGSQGRDLLEHEIWEHQSCTECGAGLGQYLDLHAVTHESWCPRLQPGYAYPDRLAGEPQ